MSHPQTRMKLFCNHTGLTFSCWYVMTSVNDVDDILEPHGGQNANDLNVKNYNTAKDDTKYEISNFGNSSCLDLEDLQTTSKNIRTNSPSLNLDIQSINSKFSLLHSILAHLVEDVMYVSVICLEESWLSVDTDVAPFSIPNYQTLTGTDISKRRVRKCWFGIIGQ